MSDEQREMAMDHLKDRADVCPSCGTNWDNATSCCAKEKELEAEVARLKAELEEERLCCGLKGKERDTLRGLAAGMAATLEDIARGKGLKPSGMSTPSVAYSRDALRLKAHEALTAWQSFSEGKGEGPKV